MGGPNSGRRLRLDSKETCDTFRRLDVNMCRRHGWLKPGYCGGIYWRRDSAPDGDIRIESFADHIELIYRTRPRGGEWRDMREVVALARTSQPFGGNRTWFSCPGCQTRRTHLYGGERFLCRDCHRLTYESRNEHPALRALSQAQNYRLRLGGSPCLDDPLPERPKGMHRATYASALGEIERLESVAMQRLNALLTGAGS